MVRLLVLAAVIAVLGLRLAPVEGGSSAHDQHSPLTQAAPRREVRVPIQDFALTDQEGRPFKFESLKGKLALVSFIYTSCPDVCPLMTFGMRKVQEGLKANEKNSVYLLSITTDPEIDRPAILKSYAGRYQADFSNWAFLTGEPNALAPVWKGFGVKVERRGKGLVDHTALTGLVDPQGVMRFVYYGGSPDPKKILEDIRRLLGRP